MIKNHDNFILATKLFAILQVLLTISGFWYLLTWQEYFRGFTGFDFSYTIDEYLIQGWILSLTHGYILFLSFLPIFYVFLIMAKSNNYRFFNLETRLININANKALRVYRNIKRSIAVNFVADKNSGIESIYILFLSLSPIIVIIVFSIILKVLIFNSHDYAMQDIQKEVSNAINCQPIPSKGCIIYATNERESINIVGKLIKMNSDSSIWMISSSGNPVILKNKRYTITGIEEQK